MTLLSDGAQIISVGHQYQTDDLHARKPHTGMLRIVNNGGGTSRTTKRSFTGVGGVANVRKWAFANNASVSEVRKTHAKPQVADIYTI